MSRIISPVGILSYPNLLVARAQQEGKEAKFSCTVVFREGTDLTALKKAAIEVAKAKWGDALKGGKLKVLDTPHGPANYLVSDKVSVRLPWRDVPSDVAKKGYPEGSTFVNANSLRKPQIVTEIKGADGKPAPLTDESKIRPGNEVRASYDLYAYDASGNKGVTCGLGNIQWVSDGDPSEIGANVGPAAVDEFDVNEDAVADLGDLGIDDDSNEEGGDPLADLIG